MILVIGMKILIIFTIFAVKLQYFGHFYDFSTHFYDNFYHFYNMFNNFLDISTFFGIFTVFYDFVGNFSLSYKIWTTSTFQMFFFQNFFRMTKKESQNKISKWKNYVRSHQFIMNLKKYYFYTRRKNFKKNSKLIWKIQVYFWKSIF